MAQAKRATAMERVKLRRELVLGLPVGISVEGARKIESVVEYLYMFRVATLEQLTRCVPGETVRRMRYWLERYPYIERSEVSVERYDVATRKWIHPRKLGVYSLTAEALIAYEMAMELGDKGYTYGKTKTEYKPSNIENALFPIELYTRALEANQGSQMAWVSNQYVATELRDEKYLKKGESLSTSGFINLGDEGMWGIGTYLHRVSSVLKHTKKTFPAQFAYVLGGIMLVRNDYFGRVQEITYQSEQPKGVHNNQYYRFVPYEFSLEHPKWFLGILRKNRWLVLDALFENIRQRGGVVEQVQYSKEIQGSSHEGFRFRVTHAADETGDRRVEYVDTTYGASVVEFISLLSPKFKVENVEHVLYVVEPGEVPVYERIVQRKGMAGIQFRLIDWPGGK